MTIYRKIKYWHGVEYVGINANHTRPENKVFPAIRKEFKVRVLSWRYCPVMGSLITLVLFPFRIRFVRMTSRWISTCGRFVDLDEIDWLVSWLIFFNDVCVLFCHYLYVHRYERMLKSLRHLLTKWRSKLYNTKCFLNHQKTGLDLIQILEFLSNHKKQTTSF